MNNKKVSIIVPVYMNEAYLGKCIDSILCQTYQNLQIILIDDGSTDSCPNICDGYAAKDKRIDVIHKSNGGVSSARNAGLSVATGDYVTFIDSDDYISEDYIESMLCYAEDSCVVVSGYSCTDEFGSIYKTVVFQSSDVEDLITKSIFGYTCMKLIDRNLISDIRFQDTLREDLIFNLNILSRNHDVKYKIIENTGYFYRQHSNSLLHSKKPYSSEFVCRSISSLYQAIYECDLADMTKQKIFNMCAFTLLNDVFHVLTVCNIPFLQTRKYIKYVYDKIPKNVLCFKYADSNLQKLTYILSKLKLFSLYTLMFKMLFKTQKPKSI